MENVTSPLTRPPRKPRVAPWIIFVGVALFLVTAIAVALPAKAFGGFNEQVVIFAMIWLATGGLGAIFVRERR